MKIFRFFISGKYTFDTFSIIYPTFLSNLSTNPIETYRHWLPTFVVEHQSHCNYKFRHLLVERHEPLKLRLEPFYCRWTLVEIWHILRKQIIFESFWIFLFDLLLFLSPSSLTIVSLWYHRSCVGGRWSRSLSFTVHSIRKFWPIETILFPLIWASNSEIQAKTNWSECL